MIDQSAALKEIAILVMWYDDTHLIVTRRFGQSYWELPGTRIAEGESLQQAGSRLALLEVSLNVPVHRFGRQIRSHIDERNQVLLRSVRVNLTYDEFESIRGENIAGTHEILVVAKEHIRDVLPRKRDRLLIYAG